MLIKTHLAITLCAILLFFPYVNLKLIFIIVALISTFIPDIDSSSSKLGHYKIFRPFQFFIKHRGIFHNFLFLILITLVFVLFFPIIALPFFLGYGLHLLADSFTIKGIKPFFPFKKLVSGKIKTGGRSEVTVFVLFVLLDLFLIISYFMNLI